MGEFVRELAESYRCPGWLQNNHANTVWAYLIKSAPRVAYRREVLEVIPFHNNSDDFVFDSQFLAQAVHFGFRIGEIPVPVRYSRESSSINFNQSIRYGILTLTVMGIYWLNRLGIRKSKLFKTLTT